MCTLSIAVAFMSAEFHLFHHHHGDKGDARFVECFGFCPAPEACYNAASLPVKPCAT